MTIEHSVVQGECLSSIAKKYGFADWRTIYDHGLNAKFRQRRQNPHVLLPGDHLSVPDKTVKTEICETTRIHTFRVARKPTRLRLIVRDIDGEPLAGKKYRLTVAGAAYEGVLPDDALLDKPIPADAADGELTVWADESYSRNTWTHGV